jgi:hypothetical protein
MKKDGSQEQLNLDASKISSKVKFYYDKHTLSLTKALRVKRQEANEL